MDMCLIRCAGRESWKYGQSARFAWDCSFVNTIHKAELAEGRLKISNCT